MGNTWTKKCNGLNIRLDKVHRALDNQEQYSRRNCLLVYGNNEENQENTNEVIIDIRKKEIDKGITYQDIDRSWCFCNFKPNKNKSQVTTFNFFWDIWKLRLKKQEHWNEKWLSFV